MNGIFASTQNQNSSVPLQVQVKVPLVPTGNELRKIPLQNILVTIQYQ